MKRLKLDRWYRDSALPGELLLVAKLEAARAVVIVHATYCSGRVIDRRKFEERLTAGLVVEVPVGKSKTRAVSSAPKTTEAK